MIKINKIVKLTQEIFDVTEQLKVLQEVYDNSLQELLNTKSIIEIRENELKTLISERDALEGRKNDTTIYPFPNYPAYPNYPIHPGEWKQQNNCPVCGLDWSGPMGYCCNNKDCPTIRATCTTL